MKNVFVVVIIFLSVSVNVVLGQESTVRIGKYHVSDFTISSGKNALTSGLDTRISFSNNGNGILFITANSDRAVVNIGKKFGNFKAIESIGVFKNIPWTGPMFLYQLGPVDMMVWNGIGLAKDANLQHPGYTPQFFFSYEDIGVTIAKNNRVGAAIMLFTTEKINWFVSYKRTFSLGEKSKVFAEITYNHTLDIPMFVVGYTLKIK